MMDRVMDEKEILIHEFIYEQLTEELDSAEEYHEHAEHAKHKGDHGLASLFMAHAKDEIRHFRALFEVIEKGVPNIKSNPLYPLLKDLEEWACEMEEEFAKMR